MHARLSFLALLPILGCFSAQKSAGGLSAEELELRKQLGIPAGAKTVVVFGQNAHLDIDWQQTFDSYYRTWVEDIFLEARQILDRDPRAFYSVAEMAYLSHHLAQHPAELDRLKAHAARGALRIVGGGITSPDSVLPETELLLRDYLLGTRFAEETLGARPRAAWLPDSFGHAATVPDLLSALGFESVALGRIDGAPAVAELLKDPQFPIKAGSTADLLARLKTADFVWRGPGGGRLLAHYFPIDVYCTGDTIDYDESLVLPGVHVGEFKGDDPSYIDRMIERYIQQMRRYTKTPYIFIPVGCDFQKPKPRLVEYLDGYDRRQYPKTGTWAVAAPFEDYARLIAFHRDQLPEIEADLTPYFMGFYGSRGHVKRRAREAARPAFAAETFATLLSDADLAATPALGPIFEKLAWSNHHDYITGTSTDDVVRSEQLPRLDDAERDGQRALQAVAGALARRIPETAGAIGRALVVNPAGAAASQVVELDLSLATPVPDDRLWAAAGDRRVPLEVLEATPQTGRRYSRFKLRIAAQEMPPFGWRMVDFFSGPREAGPPQERVQLELLDAAGEPAFGDHVRRVILFNARVRAEWAQADDFALVSLVIDGREALAGPSFGTADYADQGGLWRLGNEMPGCSLTPLAHARGGGAPSVKVIDSTPLTARVRFHAGDTIREARLDRDSDGLVVALVTQTREAETRTAAFAFAPGGGLTTSIAGGFAARPLEKLYSPTFWPAVGWAAAGSWAVLLRQSTGARMSTLGALELFAARDARLERCDFEGGTGKDVGTQRIDWKIVSAGTPADTELSAQVFNRPIEAWVVPNKQSAALDLASEGSLGSISGSGVISALKPADRGAGIVVRVLLLPGPAELRLSPRFAGRRMIRLDASERDLEDLGVAGEKIVLDRARFGAIATLRLR